MTEVLKRKRVVLISNLFPNPNDPGRGVFTFQIAKALSTISNLTVICPMPYIPNLKFLTRSSKWRKYIAIPKTYTIDGITVICPKYLMFPKISELVHAILMYAGLISTLRKLKKLNQVDIVNTHWLYPDGVASAWACKHLKIPCVLTALGSDVNFQAEHRIKRAMIRNAIRMSDGVTAVSRELIKKMASWTKSGQLSVVISNGVDLGRFSIRDMIDCRKQLSLPINKKILIYVGRLSYEKGLNFLLQAIETLGSNNIKDLHLAVIGDGPQANEYKSFIQEKKLTQIVTFYGNQKHELIPLWISASNFLCLPSIREGCPNVILEALSAGRPVIASKVGGIPDMIQNESVGLLFETGNVDSIVQSLTKALAMPWNENAIRNSLQDRSWQKVGIEYDELYTTVLKNSKI